MVEQALIIDTWSNCRGITIVQRDQDMLAAAAVASPFLALRATRYNDNDKSCYTTSHVTFVYIVTFLGLDT